jgi:hypothetical protein
VYIKYESEKLEEERNSGHLGVDKIDAVLLVLYRAELNLEQRLALLL